MSTRPPRVSIGLPVFNGENYVGAAIDSIVAQRFTDFELIVRDNASTDQTQAACEARAAVDRRIRYIRASSNVGAAANFNRVLAEARGTYFKWAAHDDLIAPDWLSRCVDVLDSDPDVVLCQTAAVEIDGTGRVQRAIAPELPCASEPDVLRRFADLVLIDHQCLDVFGLMRTETLRQTPGIARYIASDRVLLAELGLRGRFRHLPEPLFLLREHPDRSVRALPFHQRAAWFDSTTGSKRVYPHWRFYGEYFGRVRHVCRERLQRWRCYAVLGRWPFVNMNWARLLSDLVIAVWPAASAWITAAGQHRAKHDYSVDGHEVTGS